MVEDSIDDVIKKKLEDHEEYYDASSWMELSSKMDLADVNDEAYTVESIKDQLVNHQEPIIESHWQRLKAELEALEKRRYRLWLTKSVEAITLLLLIWTYANVSSLFITPQTDYKSSVGTAYASHSLCADDLMQVVQFMMPIRSDMVTDDSSDDVFLRVIDDGVPKEMMHLTQVPLTEIKRIEYSLDDMLPKSNVLIYSLVKKSPPWTHISIELSDISPLNVSIVPAHPHSTVSSGENKSFKNKNDGWWIGTGFSKDINMINSRFNIGYLRSQVNSGLIGTSASISMSWQRGVLELQSGLKYGEKGLAPGSLRTFTKASVDLYLENQLNLIEFQQLQIPLLIKLHGLNQSKTHLYGFVGVSANTILGYKYSIQKRVQPSTRVNFVDLETTIDLTGLPGGFLRTGDFETNSYLTGIIGFGLESKISDRFSFFFQSQYQHHLSKSLNDFVNQINSINIGTGIRIRL